MTLEDEKTIKQWLDEMEEKAVQRAVELVYLRLPEVCGHILTDGIAQMKMNQEFYKKHPEFKGHGLEVAKAVEMIDGQNTLIDYREKLEQAIPEIRKRINSLKSTDMGKPDRPKISDHGAI